MSIGFVTALPDEADTLMLNARNADGIHWDHIVCGAGLVNAERAALQLIDKGAQGLIAWGTAAALRSEIKPGQLIIARSIIDPDGNRLDGDTPWASEISGALAHLAPETEIGCSVRQPVADSAEKIALAKRYDVAFVDMESSAVAQCAIRANLPFAVVRAIADPADFDLPPAAVHGLNVDGLPDPAAVARGLLRRPHDIWPLMRLWRWYRAALYSLREAARTLHQGLRQQP